MSGKNDLRISTQRVSPELSAWIPQGNGRAAPTFSKPPSDSQKNPIDRQRLRYSESPQNKCLVPAISGLWTSQAAKLYALSSSLQAAQNNLPRENGEWKDIMEAQVSWIAQWILFKKAFHQVSPQQLPEALRLLQVWGENAAHASTMAKLHPASMGDVFEKEFSPQDRRMPWEALEKAYRREGLENLFVSTEIFETIRQEYEQAIADGRQDWFALLEPETFSEMVEDLGFAEATLLSAKDLDFDQARDLHLDAALLFLRWDFRQPLQASVDWLWQGMKASDEPALERMKFGLDLVGYFQMAGMAESANEILEDIVVMAGQCSGPESAAISQYALGLSAMNREDPDAAFEIFSDLREQASGSSSDFLREMSQEAGFYLDHIKTQRIKLHSVEMLEIFHGFVQLQCGKLKAMGRTEESERLEKVLAAKMEEFHGSLLAGAEWPEIWDRIDQCELRKLLFETATGSRMATALTDMDLLEVSDPVWAQQWLATSEAYLQAGEYSEAMILSEYLKGDFFAKDQANLLAETIESRSSEDFYWDIAKSFGMIALTRNAAAVGLQVYFMDFQASSLSENLIEVGSYGLGLGAGAAAEKLWMKAAGKYIKRPFLLNTGAFYVGRNVEAAGYAASRMALHRMANGFTEDWNWAEFGKEYAVAAVRFRLSYLFSKGLGHLARRSRTSAQLAEQSIGGTFVKGAGHYTKALGKHRRAKFFSHVLNHQMTSSASQALAFASADQISESLGLKEPQDLSYLDRLAQGALSNAQMNQGLKFLK